MITGHVYPYGLKSLRSPEKGKGKPKEKKPPALSFLQEAAESN
jgi:hypothetical protein